MAKIVQYVRKREIARSLGIGTSTLDRWNAEGRIKLPKPFRPTKCASLYDADEVNTAIREMHSVGKRIIKRDKALDIGDW